MSNGSWRRALVGFLRTEAASGVMLLVCAVVALGLANSPWAETVHDLLHIKIGVAFGGIDLAQPIEFWINDGLMTLFFFVVGLEIKRELTAGELRDPRKAALPIFGALGGMIVPALIYFALRRGTPGERGWGVPMATDIAFVVGVMALLGRRVPLGLKIFLLTLAIVDDLGAILVIAIFYSAAWSPIALAWAGAGIGLILALRAIGVRSIVVYALVGVGVWLAVLESGIHPTIAGVVLGLLAPSRPVGGETVSPLHRLEQALHPWVAFGVMPLFALANAGVTVKFDSFVDPVGWAVVAGLVLGKPIGIALFAWLAVSLRVAKLPTEVNWSILLGGGCLGGIGFTMALFVADLAFKGDLLDAAKIGILIGSTLSAIIGSVVLRRLG